MTDKYACHSMGVPLNTGCSAGTEQKYELIAQVEEAPCQIVTDTFLNLLFDLREISEIKIISENKNKMTGKYEENLVFSLIFSHFICWSCNFT